MATEDRQAGAMDCLANYRSCVEGNQWLLAWTMQQATGHYNPIQDYITGTALGVKEAIRHPIRTAELVVGTVRDEAVGCFTAGDVSDCANTALTAAGTIAGGAGLAVKAARLAAAIRDARLAREAAALAAVERVQIVLDSGRFPESAAHARDAMGASSGEFTIDRAGAAARRAEAMRGHQRIPGMDRDEWPPAVFREGGAGSSVRGVTPSDNRGSGASMGNQCRGLPDGTVVRAVIC